MDGQRLFGDQRVGFLLILPPLGVAEDDVAHREFLQHPGGDLAGVSADVVLAHVLGAQPDVGIEDRFGNLAQRREGRADDDVHLFDVGQLDLQAAHQVQRLGHGLVHLPVAGNNQFPFFIHTVSIVTGFASLR